MEAEYKGDAAKVMSKLVTEKAIPQACMVAHAPFMWEHSDWIDAGEVAEKLPYKAYNPSNASTLRWLYGDVITAIRKAIDNDLLDLDDWLCKLRRQG
jgi:hypothetical protein